MVRRRPSSSQFKKISRGMRGATIKNQLSGVPSMRKKFSNSRSAHAAQRGEIHQLSPSTTTWESGQVVNRRNFVERSVNRGRHRKIFLGIILAILVLALACFAAVFVFIGTLDARLAVSDSAALSEALVIDEDDGEEESAVYTVLAASFDDSSSIEMVALVRTDSSSGQACVITIPGDVLDANEEGTLSDAYAQDGDAGLVNAVEDLAGVQVSHYVYTDAAGLVSLVDALGGVELTLDSDVTDSQAGEITLSAGTQTLSGAQALFLCRANDFDNPDEGRACNVALVAAALLSQVSEAEGLGFYLQLDNVADYFKTDMGVFGLFEFVNSLRDIDLSNVMSGAMPTQASELDGQSVKRVEDDAWATMMERVAEGLSPLEDLQDMVDAIDPSSLTITVNNGGGVEGAASSAAQLLEDYGFSVSSIGNTSMQVYEETLVIYQDSENAEKADVIVTLLGLGRTVNGSVNYSFSTDILVVVGSDWESSDEGDLDA